MTGIDGGKGIGKTTKQTIVVNDSVLLSSEGKEAKLKTQGSIEKLKGSITYEQLSKLSINQRLYFVTKNKLKPSDIVKGKKIKFDFNGNIKLYQKSSAGFLIPDNILELEAGGKKWVRDENNKEFFYSNNEDGTVNRLIIGSFSNHSKGRYSEVTILKMKGSIQEKTRFKNHTKTTKAQIEEVRDNTSTKEKIIKTTSSKVENLLGNNLSNISDIKDINSLKQGDFINFDFPNKESYIKTSAGSVIPEKINYLKTSDGQIWTRKDGKGEFFNKRGRRLIIGDKNHTRGYPSIQIVDKSESLKVSTYRDLLKLPMNYRLQNVSDIIGDSTYLKTGDKIKIDFTKGVGLGKASLGEIMPIEVRSIEKDGKTYTRLNNSIFGEFLDEDMNRLRVDNGDEISVGETKTNEEVQNGITSHNIMINSLEYKNKIKETIDKLSKKYSIPKKYIYALLKGENQFWDYKLKVDGRDNTAFGLLQMVNNTWERYGKGLDRNTIIGQLKAGFNYLNYIKRLVLRKNNKEGIKMNVKDLWLEVITLYHTGPYILSVSDKKDIARNLAGNPGIVKIIKDLYNLNNVTSENVTPKMYLAGAKKYYDIKLV